MMDKFHEAKYFKSYTQFIMCVCVNFYVSLPNFSLVVTIEINFYKNICSPCVLLFYILQMKSSRAAVLLFKIYYP